MAVIQGEHASIETPAAGYGALAPKTDGKLYFKNPAGTETKLTEQLVSVTGERDDPETALANLLTVLAGLGFIVDNTTAT